MSVEMHSSTFLAVSKAVESGAAASQDEFIEAAVVARLRDIRREKVYASYREAAADPAYVEEMESIVASFDRALGDAGALESGMLEDLLREVRVNGRICPLPMHWSTLFQMLPGVGRTPDGDGRFLRR
jgi:hypothetical protein